MKSRILDSTCNTILSYSEVLVTDLSGNITNEDLVDFYSHFFTTFLEKNKNDYFWLCFNTTTTTTFYQQLWRAEHLETYFTTNVQIYNLRKV